MALLDSLRQYARPAWLNASGDADVPPSLWVRTPRARSIQAVIVMVFGIGLIILTVSALRTVEGDVASPRLQIVYVLNLIYGTALVILLFGSIRRIFGGRLGALTGSSLHRRLAIVFAFLAFVPTVMIAMFSNVVVNFSLDGWFSERVGNVVSASLVAAQAYETEQRNDLEQDIEFIAFTLSNYKRTQPLIDEGDVRIALSSVQQQIQRGLKEAYVIDGAGNIKSRGEKSYLFGFEAPTRGDFALADQGKTVVTQDWQNNEFRAMRKLANFADRYLYLSREVDGQILSLLDETKETIQLYTRLEEQRGQFFFNFALLYFMFSLIVILFAVRAGLIFAEMLSRPIERLASAARRLGDGDFNVRVQEEKSISEFALLGNVFNTMTGQLEGQHNNLLEINERTERQRRLFDEVLSNVTAGIISLSADGRIRVINNAAVTFLGIHATKDINKFIDDVVPEFATLFHQLEGGGNFVKQEKITLTRAGREEVLLVRITERRTGGGDLEGYVITFDDVTKLVSAQRMAAWGDVARRIAHEVKNPLTPIQLAAQRLGKNYSGALAEDARKDFLRHTEIIARKASDLGRIINEFSKFARMPAPNKRRCDLVALIEDAVVLQMPILEGIKVDLVKKPDVIMGNYDETMISQVAINVLKNAGEAISALQSESKKKFAPQIKVEIGVIGDQARITISDNGIGLPDTDRMALFEPYTTQREEGTGLGLSIVQRIIEEHSGSIYLEDAEVFKGCKHTGARVVILLPVGE